MSGRPPSAAGTLASRLARRSRYWINDGSEGTPEMLLFGAMRCVSRDRLPSDAGSGPLMLLNPRYLRGDRSRRISRARRQGGKRPIGEKIDRECAQFREAVELPDRRWQ